MDGRRALRSYPTILPDLRGIYNERAALFEMILTIAPD